MHTLQAFERKSLGRAGRDIDLEPRRAPSLGEHNDFVLSQLLGYDDATIAWLHASGALESVANGFARPEPVPLSVLLQQGRVREVDPDYEVKSGPG